MFPAHGNVDTKKFRHTPDAKLYMIILKYGVKKSFISYEG